jgi:hypothetical protein
MLLLFLTCQPVWFYGHNTNVTSTPTSPTSAKIIHHFRPSPSSSKATFTRSMRAHPHTQTLPWASSSPRPPVSPQAPSCPSASFTNSHHGMRYLTSPIGCADEELLWYARSTLRANFGRKCSSQSRSHFRLRPPRPRYRALVLRQLTQPKSLVPTIRL